MNTWMQIRSAIPTHLKNFVDKLSTEHPSGISFAQLDSPMMRQFKQAKSEVPDALLFFRMGDFFELFGLDAIIASDLCDLTLTSRDKSNPNPVPMAGVPACSYKTTLKKCLDAGFKVAVCDQVEDPRTAQGIVRREITRIATPAVPGDLDNNDSSDDEFGCYLASVIQSNKTFTFAYIDVSTGEFRFTAHLNADELQQEILTIRPKEILVQSSFEKQINTLLGHVSSNAFCNKTLINKIEPWMLKSEQICKDCVLEFFKESDFHSFGLSTIPGALQCVASILFYLKNTQRSVFEHISQIKYYDSKSYLILDDATKKNLDLFYTSTGEKRGSLFTFLNECQTILGSRLLVRRLNYPLKKTTEIHEELERVNEFVEHNTECFGMQNLLSQCADIEKILSRACQNSLDIKSSILLKNTINLIPIFLNFAAESKDSLSLFSYYTHQYQLENLNPLSEFLTTAISDNISAQIGSGESIFLKNHSQELDEICELEQNFSQKLKELEAKEKTQSGILNLKIGYTRVFGYYFEISRGKLAQTPTHFERKQTLTNAERFITPELKLLEEKAFSASAKRLELEKSLFENLRLQIISFSKQLINYATFIANADLITTFSYLAYKYSWCRPTVLGTPESQFEDCAHPMMKHLNSTEDEFIANSIEFSKSNNRIHLITGPNMAGKSTLMRQVALNHLLCHIGSFVCAKSARIGVLDRILSRIGSADYADKNQSTFMVEMLETSQILRLATSQSLLLLDEVGRGTSTYDGLSLAWAIVEDIHDNQCPRTLFSTHYHELVDVCQTKKNITPMQMGVLVQSKENESGQLEEELIFSRKYLPGFIGQSFGLSVAKLAGIPSRVIIRAKEILDSLEAPKNSMSYNPKTQKNKKEAAQRCAETLF